MHTNPQLRKINFGTKPESLAVRQYSPLSSPNKMEYSFVQDDLQLSQSCIEIIKPTNSINADQEQLLGIEFNTNLYVSQENDTEIPKTKPQNEKMLLPQLVNSKFIGSKDQSLGNSGTIETEESKLFYLSGLTEEEKIIESLVNKNGTEFESQIKPFPTTTDRGVPSMFETVGDTEVIIQSHYLDMTERDLSESNVIVQMPPCTSKVLGQSNFSQLGSNANNQIEFDSFLAAKNSLQTNNKTSNDAFNKFQDNNLHKKRMEGNNNFLNAYCPTGIISGNTSATQTYVIFESNASVNTFLTDNLTQIIKNNKEGDINENSQHNLLYVNKDGKISLKNTLKLDDFESISSEEVKKMCRLSQNGAGFVMVSPNSAQNDSFTTEKNFPPMKKFDPKNLMVKKDKEQVVDTKPSYQHEELSLDFLENNKKEFEKIMNSLQKHVEPENKSIEKQSPDLTKTRNKIFSDKINVKQYLKTTKQDYSNIYAPDQESDSNFEKSKNLKTQSPAPESKSSSKNSMFDNLLVNSNKQIDTDCINFCSNDSVAKNDLVIDLDLFGKNKQILRNVNIDFNISNNQPSSSRNYSISYQKDSSEDINDAKTVHISKSNEKVENLIKRGNFSEKRVSKKTSPIKNDQMFDSNLFLKKQQSVRNILDLKVNNPQVRTSEDFGTNVNSNLCNNYQSNSKFNASFGDNLTFRNQNSNLYSSEKDQQSFNKTCPEYLRAFTEFESEPNNCLSNYFSGIKEGSPSISNFERSGVKTPQLEKVSDYSINNPFDRRNSDSSQNKNLNSVSNYNSVDLRADITSLASSNYGMKKIVDNFPEIKTVNDLIQSFSNTITNNEKQKQTIDYKQKTLEDNSKYNKELRKDLNFVQESQVSSQNSTDTASLKNLLNDKYNHIEELSDSLQDERAMNVALQATVVNCNDYISKLKKDSDSRITRMHSDLETKSRSSLFSMQTELALRFSENNANVDRSLADAIKYYKQQNEVLHEELNTIKSQLTRTSFHKNEMNFERNNTCE